MLGIYGIPNSRYKSPSISQFRNWRTGFLGWDSKVFDRDSGFFIWGITIVRGVFFWGGAVVLVWGSAPRGGFRGFLFFWGFLLVLGEFSLGALSGCSFNGVWALS